MSISPQPGVVPQWTIGDRLRKARSLTGLTTHQFADEIGVSQKTISDAECDKRGVPRKILLNAYAMRTGVPVAWLLDGEVPRDNTPPTSGHARTGVWNQPTPALSLVAA